MRWGTIVASMFALASAIGQESPPDEPLETIVVPRPPVCVEQRSERFRWVETCTFKRRFHAVATLDAKAGDVLSPGVYEVSTGFTGLMLALDPDGWVGYSESADVGTPVGVEGHYAIRDGRVIVDLDDVGRPSYIAARQVFVIMRWKDRMILVPEPSMGFIANELNTAFNKFSGSLMWGDIVLQRPRDRDKPWCGLPTVDGEWRGRLHAEPVFATIVDARPDVAAATKDSPEDANLHHYRIDVDAGSDAGLFEGMYLDGLSATSRHVWLRAIVDRVDAKTASAKLNVVRETTTVSLDDVRITPGIRLSSGPPWKPRVCMKPASRGTGTAHRPSGP